MMNLHGVRALCVLALTLLPICSLQALEIPVVKGKQSSLKLKEAEAEAEVEVEVERVKFDLALDLATKLVRPDGMEFKPYRMGGAGKVDYFLVYYGAHWCPNCKKFTPKLTEFYRENRSQHRNFEVIFVSADKDEDAMLQYMNGYKMPWPAVRFDVRKEIESINRLAGRGYPCVALVDAEGKILAHSYGEDRKGDYVGPMKPVEKLKELLDAKQPLSSVGLMERANEVVR